MEPILYDPRTMLAAIELMKPPVSFLWDTFVKSAPRYLVTELAEIDYRKGEVRMAPFVASDVGGVVVGREGFNTAMFKFPTIAPERLIKPSDLSQRSFGESIYSGRTPASREEQMMAEDLTALREMIAKRKAWMVSQLLFITPGKLLLDVMTDKGLEKGVLRVDFNFTNEVTVADPWTDDDSDPMSDIEVITDAARDTGGPNPDIIIMGAGAAKAYRNNPKVREALDLKNFLAGNSQISYRGDYLKFIGISPNGLEMYSYTGTYLDDDGTVRPMVPTGGVAALSKGSINAMYGPITQLEPGQIRHTTYTDYQEVPLYLPDYKKNTTGLRLTSRPMIGPDNIDGWAIADVL